MAPGDCSPGAPTDPYVPFQAYGSSRHELAEGRHTEWIATSVTTGSTSSGTSYFAVEALIFALHMESPEGAPLSVITSASKMITY